MGKYKGKGKYQDIDETNKTVGNRIMKIRKMQGWSQEEFAQKVSTDQFDFSSSKISKIESGQQPPTIAELYKIAEILNINLLYFFGKSDNMNDKLTYDYEVASKLVRIERAGKSIKLSDELEYEADDIFLSIDEDFENYLLTEKKPNIEKDGMRKYVIFPYGKLIISCTEDYTANKECMKHLKEAEDLLKELAITSDEE
jgi:Predicted transcription factor, homolog of eukaryotic MBF1